MFRAGDQSIDAAGGVAVPLPIPKSGKRLEIKRRLLPFSFWPVARSTRRYGLQTDLFAKDPWVVTMSFVEKRCPSIAKPAARAFLTQAKEFFGASEAGATTSKPLLLYYSFLNIAKALVLTTGTVTNLDFARHGLSETLLPPGREFLDAALDIFSATATSKNIYDLLNQALGNVGLPAQAQVKVLDLLPQIVLGHRLWATATREVERFVPIHELRFYVDARQKTVWLSIMVLSEDLDRFEISQTAVLRGSGLQGIFRGVQCSETVDGKPLLQFEQIGSMGYTHRPSDVIQALVNGQKSRFWPIVRTFPPYRKYYLYLAPQASVPQNHLCTMYALMYYLGSVTRYRPQHFIAIEKSSYGPEIEDFLVTAPAQFLFLMASEFALRNVSSPAIL